MSDKAVVEDIDSPLETLRHDRKQWSKAKRVEIAWQDCPTFLLIGEDGSRYRYELSVREAWDWVRRLMNFLSSLNRWTAELHYDARWDEE